MNFKNKLRMGFFIALIMVAVYLLIYYFYNDTNYNDSGQGILVMTPHHEV